MTFHPLHAQSNEYPRAEAAYRPQLDPHPDHYLPHTALGLEQLMPGVSQPPQQTFHADHGEPCTQVQVAGPVPA